MLVKILVYGVCLKDVCDLYVEGLDQPGSISMSPEMLSGPNSS